MAVDSIRHCLQGCQISASCGDGEDAIRCLDGALEHIRDLEQQLGPSRNHDRVRVRPRTDLDSDREERARLCLVDIKARTDQLRTLMRKLTNLEIEHRNIRIGHRLEPGGPLIRRDVAKYALVGKTRAYFDEAVLDGQALTLRWLAKTQRLPRKLIDRVDGFGRRPIHIAFHQDTPSVVRAICDVFEADGVEELEYIIENGDSDSAKCFKALSVRCHLEITDIIDSGILLALGNTDLVAPPIIRGLFGLPGDSVTLVRAVHRAMYHMHEARAEGLDLEIDSVLTERVCWEDTRAELCIGSPVGVSLGRLPDMVINEFVKPLSPVIALKFCREFVGRYAYGASTESIDTLMLLYPFGAVEKVQASCIKRIFAAHKKEPPRTIARELTRMRLTGECGALGALAHIDGLVKAGNLHMACDDIVLVCDVFIYS